MGALIRKLKERFLKFGKFIQDNKTRILWALAALLVAALLYTAYFIYLDWPGLQLWGYDLGDKERLDALENIRGNLLKIFGGVLAVIGIGAAVYRSVALNRTAKASLESADAAHENARVAQAGNVSESFTRAIDQLGSTKMDIRLGGVYSLDHIARDTEDYKQTVANVLCAFIRENSAKEENVGKVRTDIQAALTAIGSDVYKACDKDLSKALLEKFNLDMLYLAGAVLREANLAGTDLWKTALAGAVLREANLAGADLREANLAAADLQKANLAGADLRKANLASANLCNANLAGADLFGANLAGAALLGANLQKANLFGANLTGADLRKAALAGAALWKTYLQKANLAGADLRKADLGSAKLFEANLRGANLAGANLDGAVFAGADLRGANLTDANLRGANLAAANNLTTDRLSQAQSLYDTQLEDNLKKEIEAIKPELFRKPEDSPVKKKASKRPARKTPAKSARKPAQPKAANKKAAKKPVKKKAVRKRHARKRGKAT